MYWDLRNCTSLLQKAAASAFLSACIVLNTRQASAADFIVEFPTPSANSLAGGIVSGPDGNLWYAGVGLVGRVTPQGLITEFPLGDFYDLQSITVGSDGNLWTGDVNGNLIFRVTPSGVITQFPTPNVNSQPAAFATGKDGNVWFTERAQNAIGRIAPNGVVTEYPIPFPEFGPGQIAAGPDGNLWFTLGEAFTVNSIGRITTSGVMTFFPLSSNVAPSSIAAGPDGNVWFTEYLGQKIGRITPSGSITEFAFPLRYPGIITTGPEGNLWVTTSTTIEVMSVSGIPVREIALPSNINGAGGITTGPDGKIWFTLPFAGLPTVSLRSEVCRVDLPRATSFHTLNPCRVLDTRNAPSPLGGPALSAGVSRDFIVTGTCGIPASALSISVNVTVTQPTSAGTLCTLPAVFPVLPFQAAVTRANNAILLLAPDGSGTLTLVDRVLGPQPGSVDVIVDVNGWWE